MIQQEEGFLGFSFLFSPQSSLKGNGSKGLFRVFRLMVHLWLFFYLGLKMVFWESSMTVAREAHMDVFLSNSS